jgi:hypothetical protein
VATGLWLVGDHGIYLMSNGLPAPLHGAAPRQVAYAEEADPDRDPETSCDVKQRAFGGDDGIIVLSGPWVTALLRWSLVGRVCINLTAKRVSVASPKPRKQRWRKRGMVDADAPA